MTSLTRVRAGGVRLIRSRRGRIWMVLAIAGPGVVAANAGNDAAGIATYASAGSQFVYRTLFFMVLVTFALVLVQEMAVRLGTHTGKGLAALIREQFSLRLTGVALFCVLLANTGLVVSEFAGIGAAFQLLGVSRYVIIPIAAVAIWALVVFGSYRYAERIFLILSLAFLAYPIAAILGHPNWVQVGTNLVIPHFLYTKSFLLLGVALIGTTVSPYMQLYAAAGVVDKGADVDDYPRARIDAISGALFACIISITIIIATAAAIGGRGPLTSAKEAAEALPPVAGPAAELRFAFRLLASIVKTSHTLLFQFKSFLLELFALVLCFNMLHLQMKTLIFHRFTLRLQTLEQVLHTHARAPQELTGALNDPLVESQAIGNGQRITSPW
jgi:NRAMP (natural resistance-associated macrophage protein)-like metal ion transporter